MFTAGAGIFIFWWLSVALVLIQQVEKSFLTLNEFYNFEKFLAKIGFITLICCFLRFEKEEIKGNGNKSLSSNNRTSTI